MLNKNLNLRVLCQQLDQLASLQSPENFVKIKQLISKTDLEHPAQQHIIKKISLYESKQISWRELVIHIHGSLCQLNEEQEFSN